MAENKKQIIKKYYDVLVDCMVPGKLIFRVYAENENEALELIKKSPPRDFIPTISKRKDLKATVKEAGSAIIKLVKNYNNGR